MDGAGFRARVSRCCVTGSRSAPVVINSGASKWLVFVLTTSAPKRAILTPTGEKLPQKSHLGLRYGIVAKPSVQPKTINNKSLISSGTANIAVRLYHTYCPSR